MKARRVTLGLALWLGCGSDLPPCPAAPELLPASGTGPLVDGSLVPLAAEQSLVISETHDWAEYRFKHEGISYTARYALSRSLPPVAYPIVFVQRPSPPPACAGVANLGPTIDAIEVLRNGAIISTGESSGQTARQCEVVPLAKPSPLDGPPDGLGAPLGGANNFYWRLSRKVTLQPGDEVRVTVLDASAGTFDVFAGHSSDQAILKLGTLTGSGTVRMP